MKTLYIECKMGIAGDMLGAALLGLFDDQKAIVGELNDIGLRGVVFERKEADKCGIRGNQLAVLVNGEEELVNDNNYTDEHVLDGDVKHQEHDHDDHHHHNSLHEIEDIIESANLSREVKSDIREIYTLLAEAESKAHGVPVSHVHFHEIGAMDAIADITATCFMMHKLSPDRVIVSPINVGSGTVKCAHGILPVPAPATLNLLLGIPYYESQTIKSELCTPTGAALVKYFADEFSYQPVMSVIKTGYGLGKKDFKQANVVRVLWGETQEENEQIIELTCNIDDMTAEEIGFAKEALFEAGALEVYTISADMKKDRPGIVLVCLCNMDLRDKIVQQIFKHTTTIGIRENVCNRYVLAREIKKFDTPYGEIRKKIAFGYNVTREKWEYDDLAGIARRTGKSIIELKREICGEDQ
ncbi:nickel pincer cofactor biosynthesis protein LarC [Butyrivibrio sp. YAB3001]|uniref:nickel pincer cofactor biosynthesis protein LarC n=1 Tax=Butyrivibrio sp. YAB3001 TaxID=1520812 RepID=UPI0008F62E8D|nr:nickel pincer cofactor biosynthesis protein LarC [Butyrivibrio sp. YAB3001]SFC86373.1 hypothetical protein SAMN02910398_03339 [Butyrivibrio sp. YAB3001]